MQSTDSAVNPEVIADLAPTGAVRVAINLGNAVLAKQDAESGVLRGVTVDLARDLGRRLGREVAFVLFENAGKVVAAVKDGAWDVGFLAIDPLRAAEIDFTPPYVLIEGAYVVRRDSPLHRVADVDRAGVRVAVGGGSAYDLFLSRALKQAQIVRAATSAAALEMFRSAGLEAGAGIRQPVAAFARGHEDLRVIEEPFMQIRQAVAIPKGRAAGARFATAFIEEMKASGFILRSLAESGEREALVAPPG